MNKKDKFIDLATKHGEAWKIGDHKVANNIHGKLMKMKESGELPKLKSLLIHENEAVKLWSAVFLLPISTEEALTSLKQLEVQGNYMASTASMMIDMWSKGML